MSTSPSTKVSDVTQALDALAPLRYAEPWDNVGLLVGDPGAPVRRVLVTVDYARPVADEARAKGVELVVAYHPPLFAAVKRVPHDATWAEAVRSGIALYSPHTALDVAAGGTNDFLADACAIATGDRRPLRPLSARDLAQDTDGLGLGRVGAIQPAPVEEVVARVKRALGLDHVLVAARPGALVTRVAVAAGAGGELLDAAVRAGADLFLTGEVRHHDAIEALHRGLTVVATLHSNSERAAVRAFAARLSARLPAVEVLSSERDRDPFAFA